MAGGSAVIPISLSAHEESNRTSIVVVELPGVPNRTCLLGIMYCVVFFVQSAASASAAYDMRIRTCDSTPAKICRYFLRDLSDAIIYGTC